MSSMRKCPHVTKLRGMEPHRYLTPKAMGLSRSGVSDVLYNELVEKKKDLIWRMGGWAQCGGAREKATAAPSC